MNWGRGEEVNSFEDQSLMSFFLKGVLALMFGGLVEVAHRLPSPHTFLHGAKNSGKSPAMNRSQLPRISNDSEVRGLNSASQILYRL